MKKTKIIIPALGMLLLSTAASVSGTVAWFSMNSSVTVSGMTVTTKVSSNLLIAEHNVDSEYAESIAQARSGVLEPASTYNGVGFWYTTTARPDGSAIAPASGDTYAEYGESSALDNTGAGKANYDSAFNTEYEFGGTVANDVCYAFIDYSFYLKATAATSGLSLSMTKCDLQYNSDGNGSYANPTTGFAWRVGMFASAANSNTEVADSTVAAAGNLKTILDFGTKTRNQNEVQLVDVAAGASLAGKYAEPTCQTELSGNASAAGKYYSLTADGTGNTPKAVKDGDELDGVTNPGAQAVVAQSTSAGQSLLYKVVVRLWLEGEDVTCTNNTYANLTSNWKLDLEFKLGNASTAGFAPVAQINDPANA